MSAIFQSNIALSLTRIGQSQPSSCLILPSLLPGQASSCNHPAQYCPLSPGQYHTRRAFIIIFIRHYLHQTSIPYYLGKALTALGSIHYHLVKALPALGNIHYHLVKALSAPGSIHYHLGTALTAPGSIHYYLALALTVPGSIHYYLGKALPPSGSIHYHLGKALPAPESINYYPCMALICQCESAHLCIMLDTWLLHRTEYRPSTTSPCKSQFD